MVQKRWLAIAAVVLMFIFGPLGLLFALFAYIYFKNLKSQSGEIPQSSKGVDSEDAELKRELEEVREDLAESQAREYGEEPEGAEESVSNSQKDDSAGAEDFLRKQEERHKVKIGGN